MTYPVHRSEEPDARARGEAFGRAHAEAVTHTVRTYKRMFAETGVTVPTHIPAPEWAIEEIEAIATGAGVDPHDLLAVNARTEILAGAGPSECSVVGAGGLLAQNWDWHPDLAAATVVWIVREADGRWFATLTEAGMLAKIGLNDAGLGVCLNLLRTSVDGGVTGTPIHILLRETLERARTVDQAVELLTAATVSASSAVTVAEPGDVASVELSPGGANVIRGGVGAHTNHFLEPPPRGEDALIADSPSTVPRLETVRSNPLLDALRSHDGHPKGVCRHLDESEPWAEQSVTIASVVMNLAARRFHVAHGQPCTHEHVQIELPPLTPPPRGAAPLAATAGR
jgi:isopenicillin-N N-acyltransferase-like protein